MHACFVNEIIDYDGTQLSSLWAFRTFGLQGDSIAGFRGSCRVDVDRLVDVADLIKCSPIASRDMLHFIVEHFDLDLEKTIIRQRLLVTIARDILERYAGINLVRSGDDLFYNERKLSVSIATLTPVSTMIHTGLNVCGEGAPVPAAGLFDLGLTSEMVPVLGEVICRSYAEEIGQIKMARCKVRGVK
ncbi:MAG: DUF366 family protein [Peptococcaceae bacterium]|nr:MAG: DUF366 family protein [Peptococcaceae bacterium]